MKKLLYLFFITILLMSCSKTENVDGLNKVLLLKVDYLTNAFEGGKELTFPQSTSAFTITTDYKSLAILEVLS
jgi:hypothetical protein